MFRINDSLWQSKYLIVTIHYFTNYMQSIKYSRFSGCHSNYAYVFLGNQPIATGQFRSNYNANHELSNLAFSESFVWCISTACHVAVHTYDMREKKREWEIESEWERETYMHDNDHDLLTWCICIAYHHKLHKWWWLDYAEDDEDEDDLMMCMAYHNKSYTYSYALHSTYPA